ncbi:uncharacterized protein MELLADRAFT_58969 [Melampsora larici-populina 98AG31]|uniref:Uncharacterized protein n=1 Tax=Melampsora larici-populina (strain 98AG31 / pathotype 3-4-7) TaxID=747676 RepID=F4R6K8_MELLP|nr:uncharacterized protein MELLADRAFT_58969 [Melampsora larici-populina 98AG31]EGG12446.1 hypothetical protein MELLADRAFT_58969 [Melampsora larici-populina 98AG31]
MSINIYGNITLVGNSSITTTRISRRRPRCQQTRPEVEDLAIGNVPNEDAAVEHQHQAIEHQPHVLERPEVEDLAIANVPNEDVAVEHQNQEIELQPHVLEHQPPLRQNHQVAQQPRRNNRPLQRRSSRIARRANLIRRPIRRRRLPLPSVHEDPYFWTSIWSLPPNLRMYLSPEWQPVWCTQNLLRQILWHFKPNLQIPCGTLKAELIELFQSHVVYHYGAYYGI